MHQTRDVCHNQMLSKFYKSDKQLSKTDETQVKLSRLQSPPWTLQTPSSYQNL